MKYSVTLLNGDVVSKDNMDEIHDEIYNYAYIWVCENEGGPFSGIDFEWWTEQAEEEMLETLLIDGLKP